MTIEYIKFFLFTLGLSQVCSLLKNSPRPSEHFVLVEQRFSLTHHPHNLFCKDKAKHSPQFVDKEHLYIVTVKKKGVEYNIKIG